MPHPAAFKVHYQDEIKYYNRQEQAQAMQEIEAELAHQERQRIERLELQAQARILEELDARQMESGGNWLGIWIDLKTEINQRMQKLRG